MSPSNQNERLLEGEEGDSAQHSELRHSLLEWFDAHKRDLPWRHVDDPYAVWVSEMMLQQTQVTTVVDYFERWMARFPDVEELADAPVEEVLELWSGLGYYRRARYVHRAAQRIVKEYNAEVPSTVAQLRELPGIGPYTAGAIASIAFGKREPVVDGNVMRVISRLYAIEGDPRRAPAKEAIWKRAAEVVDPDRPGDFNQGLMELGSLVCTTGTPKCTICPVRQWCKGEAMGDPGQFPTPKKRRAPEPMRARCCVVHRRGEDGREFLLRRRPEGGLLGGLWEFPSCEREGKTWPKASLLERRIGEPIEVDGPQIKLERALGTVEHIFSHRRLKMRIHDLAVEHRRCGGHDDQWRWVAAEELSQVASAALLKKIETLWRAKSQR